MKRLTPLLLLTTAAAPTSAATAQEPTPRDTAPLVATTPSEAAIVAESRDTELGVTTWMLANGVRVILKPTDAKDDEVFLGATSPGGTSLVPDSLYFSAQIATDAVQAGGLGRFSAGELQKKLADLRAYVIPYISLYQEGLVGGASPRDLRTLFELVYLTFIAPRADPAAFEALRAGLRTRLASRTANPVAVFQDTVQAVLAQSHPRRRPLTVAALDSLDLTEALAVYRDRFADASDFTFVLVGAFALDSVRPLVRHYLGNLPAVRRRETPRDLGIAPPAGVVRRTVRQGLDPESRTELVFPGAFADGGGADTPAERFLLATVARVLEMRLRDELRDTLGGASGLSVQALPWDDPRSAYTVTVRFGSKPERAEELAGIVLAQVDSLRRHGATAAEVARLEETALRERQTELEQSGFWLQQLVATAGSGERLRDALDLRRRFTGLTGDRIGRAAARYLNPNRYVHVTLIPEEATAGAPGAPRVFLDCPLCPLTRVLQEIPFVYWVRDRADADLHVLVIQQPTGGGGQAYRFAFLGRGKLAGRADTLSYIASRTATADEVADGIVRTLQLGLVQYAAATPVGARLRVVYEPPSAREGEPGGVPPPRDPWNAWVFAVNVSGSLSGEQRYQSASFSGGLSASRTTAALKLVFRASGSYQRSTYELAPGQSFVSTERNYAVSALAVRSVGAHWAAGLVASAASRSFYNQDLAVQGGPAVEYNVFPYAESARRQLTLRYTLKPQAMRYAEATIFDKRRETLLTHALDVSLQFTQPWGSATTTVAASQYLGDLGKHRVSMDGSLNLRLFRGLALSLFGSVSRIKDQIYLPKAGLTNEEILTRRQQLGTDYTYATTLGFSYQFGSALSAIVNPRLAGAE